MTRERLEKLLDDIRHARIGVIGDFRLDAYWTMDSSLSATSVETGLPTRAVRLPRYSLGGAGNVASNLLAMGVTHVRAFGIVGTDPFGREMLRILGASGVNTRGILVQEDGWDTSVYIKPIEEEQEQSRIDLGNANAHHVEKAHDLLRALNESLASLDLVIINQQLLHGIHTEELMQGLAAIAARAPIPFLCDSRSFSDSYAGAMRKLNEREALAADARGARYFGDSGIEIVSARPRAGPVTHALFDNDGTISVLRQGWEAIMESVMVREFGRVPEAEVKSAQGYKSLYDEGLFALVSPRIAALSSGERSVEEVHAPGRSSAPEGSPCGGRLENRGQEDRAGGILSEMGETKRRGGYAIGVASDELRRFGWNWSKRARLIRAGADLVVPDFSRWKTLLELLGVRA